MLFQSRNPPHEYLRKKWVAKHRDLSEKFMSKHGQSLKHLSLGIGGLILLTTPGMTTAEHHLSLPEGQKITFREDKNALLAQVLKGTVPDEVRKLTGEEEDRITKILSTNLGIEVKVEMKGIRLNRSYGLIGGEQHLYRFPGDNLYRHADSAADWANYGEAGIAPGLGAWGYFAPSEAEFTPKDKERERYYIAVQTFLAPGFAENFARYRDFFRFRKMLVINPQTGQAVVVVVGDAGPAEWTGKHLGGSPEVMDLLGLGGGARKGPVLYFFIDDPNDQLSLGSISMKGRGNL